MVFEKILLHFVQPKFDIGERVFGDITAGKGDPNYLFEVFQILGRGVMTALSFRFQPKFIIRYKLVIDSSNG